MTPSSRARALWEELHEVMSNEVAWAIIERHLEEHLDDAECLGDEAGALIREALAVGSLPGQVDEVARLQEEWDRFLGVAESLRRLAEATVKVQRDCDTEGAVAQADGEAK